VGSKLVSGGKGLAWWKRSKLRIHETGEKGHFKEKPMEKKKRDGLRPWGKKGGELRLPLEEQGKRY